ncbi:MAG TPA: hypothetical protein DDX98_03340 [Bacteroidales bacterium]|jgi:hypothetical protein|nr:hypothetical protein [Bacteroidales bacterium]
MKWRFELKYTDLYIDDKEKKYIPKYEDMLDYIGKEEALILYNIADTFHYSSIKDEKKMIVLHPTVISIFLKDGKGSRFNISFVSQKYDGIIAYIEDIFSDKDYDYKYKLLNFNGHDDHWNRKLILNIEDDDVKNFFGQIKKADFLDQMVKWSKSIKPRWK